MSSQPFIQQSTILLILVKQLATMSQIGKGRVGLNIVAGWHRPEYEALGLKLPQDHETRYAYAQEWFDVVQKLWQEEEYFNWEGKVFQSETSEK